MMNKQMIALLAAASLLSACSSVGGEGFGYSDYSLVRVQRLNVGDGSMSVAAPRPWKRFVQAAAATSVARCEAFTSGSARVIAAV